MNVVCTSDICPIALNSKCVFYESSALPNTGIATNDSVQVALQKIDAFVATIGGGDVESVNGQTGIVVLTAADVSAAAAGDNISIFTNDSGYITGVIADGDYWKITGTTVTNNPIISVENDGTVEKKVEITSALTGSPTNNVKLIIGNLDDGLGGFIPTFQLQANEDATNGTLIQAADRNLFLITFSGGTTNTLKISPTGSLIDKIIDYTSDVSGTYTSRSLADWGNVWKVKGTTLLTTSVDIQTSDGGTLSFLTQGDASVIQIGDGISGTVYMGILSDETLNAAYAQISASNMSALEQAFLTFDIDNYAGFGSGVIFTDVRTTKKGIEYGADYSTDFTNRSLADWGNVWRGFGTTTLSGDTVISGSGFVNGIEFDSVQYFRLIGGSQLSIVSGNSTMSSSASVISLNNSVSGSGVNISEGRILITPGTSTLATLNLGQRTAEPSSFTNGDMWYNSTTNKFRARENGVSVDLIGGGGITNSAANTELMVSDGTNAIGSNLYMSGTGSTLTLSLGNSSYAGSNRLFGSAGSAAAVGLQIFSKGASELSLSGSPVVAQSNSTTLGAVLTSFKVRTRSLGGVEVPGIGVAIAFETETDTANFEIGGIIESVSTNVTSTTEAFDLVFKTMTAGAAAVEKLRISGSQITISTATLRTIGPGNTSATDSLVVMDSDSHVIASFSNDENLNIGSGGTYASGPAGVVFMSNVDTAPVATPTSGVFIYSQDSGDTNATLAIYTEQAVEAIGTFTASNKLKIRINGVEYWIQLDAV